MEEDTEEQLENSEEKRYEHLRPWQFKPGQSGNPGGRPKGSISLKEYAKRYLMEMSDEEKIDFLKGLNKIDIWKQAEGNPQSNTDITTKGDKIESNVVPELIAEADRILREKKLNE